MRLLQFMHTVTTDHAGVLHGNKAGGAGAGATLLAAWASWADWLPELMAVLASLAGIALSVVLIYINVQEYRRKRRDEGRKSL